MCPGSIGFLFLIKLFFGAPGECLVIGNFQRIDGIMEVPGQTRCAHGSSRPFAGQMRCTFALHPGDAAAPPLRRRWERPGPGWGWHGRRGGAGHGGGFALFTVVGFLCRYSSDDITRGGTPTRRNHGSELGRSPGQLTARLSCTGPDPHPVKRGSHGFPGSRP